MNWKKIASLPLYVLPGFGLYKELKKPKEKRKIHNKIGWGLYSSGAVLKLMTLPFYIHVGNQTGDWSPINILNYYIFNKTEQKAIELKNKNLEKTIQFEEASTSVKN